MSYYPTIEEDLARAKAILAEGKPEEAELAAFDALSPEIKAAWSRATVGTIFGKDIYAAYKLLESFVAEIERLQKKDAVKALVREAQELGIYTEDDKDRVAALLALRIEALERENADLKREIAMENGL